MRSSAEGLGSSGLVMVEFVCFRCFLLLLAVSQVASRECVDWSDSSDCYSYFYLKFEEALIKDHSQLEGLRTTFISFSADAVIEFVVGMSAVNLADIYCDNTYFDGRQGIPTFCNSSQNWGLCNNCNLDMRLQQKQKFTATEQQIFYLILHTSIIHGNSLFYWPLYATILSEDEYDYYNGIHTN